MENQKRKNIILFIIILVIIISIITISIIIMNTKNSTSVDNNSHIKDTNNTEEWVITEEDGKKVNKSKEINNTKKFEGLTLKTQQFVSKNSKTEMIIQVNNETEKDTELQPVVITLLDKEGKEIVKLNGIINPTKAGETTNLHISSSLDYADAYDYKIEKANI